MWYFFWNNQLLIMDFLRVILNNSCEIFKKSRREKCLNTEFLLVCIFPHLDWFVSLRIQSKCVRIRTRKILRIWTLFTQWMLWRGQLSNHYLQIWSKYSEIFRTNLQSECRNIKTRNNSVFGYFSCSDTEWGFYVPSCWHDSFNSLRNSCLLVIEN